MSNAYHYQHTFDDNLAREFRNVLTVKSQLPVTEGLQLWLDGEDQESIVLDAQDNVARWKDKSGLEQDALQYNASDRPIISTNLQNSKQGVFFDYAGNKPMLVSSYLPTTEESITAFVLAKRVDSTSSYVDGSVYKTLLSSGSPDTSGVETGKFNMAEQRDNGRVNTVAHKVNAYNTPDGGMLDGEAHILSSVLNIDGNNDGYNEGRGNGLVEERDNFTSANVADEIWPMEIGGSQSAGSRRFWGTIYEVIIFNRVLTEIEIEAIEVYLADKWVVYHPLASWIQNYDPRVQAAIHAGQLTKDNVHSNQSPLAAWFDTRDTNTITIENNKVATWQSKAFTNHKFEQGSDILRPSLVENAINGLPAIEITGDEWMYVIGLYGAGFPQEGGTLFIAGEIAYDETTTPRLLFDYFASNRNHIFIRPYNGIGLQVAFQANDGTYKWVHGNLLNSHRFILRLTWDTVNNVGSLWVNGSAESVNQAITGAAWVPDDQRFMLRTLLTEGMLVGEVLLYDTVLPIVEQERVEQELLTAWGEA